MLFTKVRKAGLGLLVLSCQWQINYYFITNSNAGISPALLFNFGLSVLMLANHIYYYM